MLKNNLWGNLPKISKQKTLSSLLTISVFFSFFFVFAQPAAAAACYDWNNPDSLGNIIECILPGIFRILRIIVIIITVVLTVWVVYKTFSMLGTPNAQSLQELPMHWLYVFILILVAAGGGSVLLNFFLDLFGFGTIEYWYDELIAQLDLFK